MIKTLIKTFSPYLAQTSKTGYNCSRCSLRWFASFTVRDVMHERIEEGGTLLVRFAKHIALEGHNNSNNAVLVPTEIRYADFFPVSDMRYFKRELEKTASNQIPSLIVFASTYRSNADPVKFAAVLNDIDQLASKRLESMDDDTVLRTLYAWLFLIPNWLTRTDFYHAAMRRFSEMDVNADMTKEIFMELCFYLGMNKKTQVSNQNILRNLLEGQLERHLPHLSTMDLIIVSNAAYKTSTFVDNVLYNKRLEEEVLNLPLEGTYDALLVTLVKALRFQRINSVEVCERLSNLCCDTKAMRHLQNRGLVHIFAYFAGNLWDKNECIDPIVNEYLLRLPNTNRFSSYTESFRTKDLATFLWSCAQLNCSISATELQRIETIILQNIEGNKFRYNPDQLVDCCLWLWTGGLKSRQILQETIKLKTKARPNQREQPKVESRFTVLLTLAEIEEPTWVPKSLKKDAPFNEDVSAPEYLLKNRTDLTKGLAELANDDDIADAKLVCPINGINIPSLLVTLKEPADAKIFVEFLTSEQTLQFSDNPNAILRLKERMLQALGHKVIVIKSKDVLNDYSNLRDAIGLNSDPTKQQKSARSI